MVYIYMSTYPDLDIVELSSIFSDLFVGHVGHVGYLNVQVFSERNIILLRVIDLLEYLLAGLNKKRG